MSNTERQRALRLAGFCHCGRAPAPGRKRCPTCLECARKSTLSRRHRLLAKGICYKCGHNRQADGNQLCLECRGRGNTAAVKRRQEHSGEVGL